MNIPEIKLGHSYGNETDDAILNRLINNYGVNGILSTMANILLDSSEGADSEAESVLLQEISDDLNDTVLTIMSRLK